MSTVTRWTVNTIQGHGNFNQPVNIGKITDIGGIGVDRHSGVFASICEVSQPAGQPLDFPFIGGAGVEVRNIAPKDDGTVELALEVGWESDLNIRIQLLICND